MKKILIIIFSLFFSLSAQAKDPPKKYWKSALPKIKDHFDIANIHHISGPDGQCDKELWVDEFAALLKSVNVNKPKKVNKKFFTNRFY